MAFQFGLRSSIKQWITFVDSRFSFGLSFSSRLGSSFYSRLTLFGSRFASSTTGLTDVTEVLRPNAWPAKVPSIYKNTYGWKSWKDIPDEMIPKTSPIDIDNDIYKTKQYINLRKKQIWYQIPDDKPIWLKNGLRDQIEYYIAFFGTFFVLFWSFYGISKIMFKGSRPRKVK